MDINISLEQGKQFKKLQKNIIKKTKIKEAYSNNYLNTVVDNETKDFIHLQKKTREGFVNNNSNNVINDINSTNTMNEIQVLQKQFDSLMSQYVSLKNGNLTADKNLINRTNSKSNKFLNNNIQLTDGSKGYVNNSGVVKWYGTDEVFNNTAGKNGCPSNNNMMSVNFAQNAEYQNPGATIPVDPALKVGTYMLNGQGCGNEGKNVYVSKMINSNKSTNIGCYNNKDGNGMTRSLTTNESVCKTFAINQGYKYYGLGDYDSNTNNGACYLGNDKTSATQYGLATNISTIETIWSSNTANKNVQFVQFTQSGSLIVVNNNNETIFSTTSDESCKNSYSISQNTDAPGNGTSTIPTDNIEGCQSYCSSQFKCVGFTYDGSNCEIKSDITNTTSKSGSTLYTRLPKPNDLKECVYFLTLQADGNMCIYKGNSPSNIKGNAIWCSMTNGKQKDANSDWISSKGITGKSYMFNGIWLWPGQWIGSDDGKLRLILQKDGNLVLQTTTNAPSCVTNPKDNMVYGNKGVISIYELEASGIKDNMGKLGYVDENSDLREYSASMIGNSNDYNIQQNTSYMPASGNDVINQSTVKNIDECQTACNNNNNCKGFMLAQSSNICVQYKNTNGSIFNGASGYTFGQRKPKLLNDASCGLDYTEIDTNQWQNYNKGKEMSSTTKCGYALVNEDNQKKLEEIKSQIVDVSNKLIEKTEQLTNSNQKINNSINVDKNRLQDKLNYYKNIKNKIQVESSKEGFLNMADINGMLSDSNINVLAANYNYILWSIFALGLVTITLKHINK
jgi:hypothetical protein